MVSKSHMAGQLSNTIAVVAEEMLHGHHSNYGANHHNSNQKIQIV